MWVIKNFAKGKYPPIIFLPSFCLPFLMYLPSSSHLIVIFYWKSGRDWCRKHKAHLFNCKSNSTITINVCLFVCQSNCPSVCPSESKTPKQLQISTFITIFWLKKSYSRYSEVRLGKAKKLLIQIKEIYRE